VTAIQAIRIYLETSVISAYHFGKDSILRATRKFYDVCMEKGYGLCTSDVTLREIDRSSPSAQEKLYWVVEEFRVQIRVLTDEADRLAQEYVRRNVIPSKFRADAEHIAVCSVNGFEVLASWNLRHIVNLRTKMMVKAINTELGYMTPDIVRPDEVLAFE